MVLWGIIHSSAERGRVEMAPYFISFSYIYSTNTIEGLRRLEGYIDWEGSLVFALISLYTWLILLATNILCTGAFTHMFKNLSGKKISILKQLCCSLHCPTIEAKYTVNRT